MLNFQLNYLPNYTSKPRETALSMVMDKGLSLLQARELVESAGHLVDFVKLGFGTSIATAQLAEKIRLYQQHGIKVYFGGTLFEAFLVRDQLEDYRRLLDHYKLDTVEVSDGTIKLDEQRKCALISDFSKNYRVLSEVGSKNESVLIEPKKWIRLINQELAAGAYKVIAEARESGNVGIYRANGKQRTVLINRILASVDPDKIIWEAPQKSQQVAFIKLLGSHVNLGNLAPSEVVACHTLRMGLRGDTFFDHLPESIRTTYMP